MTSELKKKKKKTLLNLQKTPTNRYSWQREFETSAENTWDKFIKHGS